MKDDVFGLEQNLARERYYNERLQHNVAVIQHQHSQTRAKLRCREDEWTARLHRAKVTIANLLNELKGAASALYHTHLPYRIADHVEYEALRVLEEGSRSSAPVNYTSNPPLERYYNNGLQHNEAVIQHTVREHI